MPLKLITAGGGSVILDANTTASNYTLTAPARNGSLITSGDSGTITGSMIAADQTLSGNVTVGSIIAPTVNAGYMSYIKTWYLGQPTNMILSGGTDCYTLKLNRSAMYYCGFVWDVHMQGGFDWGGNGYATYWAKMMITYLDNTSIRVHLISEYGRSYLNNSGTEIRYSSASNTYDSTYNYVTIRYYGANASAGYKPMMNIITYDMGGVGSAQVNSVYKV